MIFDAIKHLSQKSFPVENVTQAQQRGLNGFSRLELKDHYYRDEPISNAWKSQNQGLDLAHHLPILCCGGSMSV